MKVCVCLPCSWGGWATGTAPAPVRIRLLLLALRRQRELACAATCYTFFILPILKGLFIFPPAQRNPCAFHSLSCSFVRSFPLAPLGFAPSSWSDAVAAVLERSSVQHGVRVAACSSPIALNAVPGCSKVCLNTQSCGSSLLPRTTKAPHPDKKSVPKLFGEGRALSVTSQTQDFQDNPYEIQIYAGEVPLYQVTFQSQTHELCLQNWCVP